MSTPIQSIVRFQIHTGKLDEFNLIASQCLEIVKEKDTGTLQYDWFFSDDNTECVVIERYETSEALLEHMANLGDKLGQAMRLSHFSAEIFGSPTPAVLEAIAGLDVRIYPYFAGL